MNEEFYKKVVFNSPSAYAYHKLICDEDGKACDFQWLDVNPAFERITGLLVKDIIGKRVTEILPTIVETEFDWFGLYGRVALDGDVEEFEQYSEPLDKYFRVRAYSPKKEYFITIFEDISIETVASMQKTKNFQLLFNNMKGGAGIYDVINDGKYGKDYIIKDINDESLRVRGKTKEEVLGKSLYDVWPEIDQYSLIENFRNVWKSGEIQHFPSKVYFDDENERTFENDVYRFEKNTIASFYSDVTEIKKLAKEKVLFEANLREQQKLESIGVLASGVAHEINNPINGILNYGQVILDSDIGDISIKDYAKEIINETNRVAEIVKDLLNFSRQNNQEHSYANIEDIISQTLSLVYTILKHDQIELILNIAKDLPRIKCRSQQIQQVIMNLITNARDALNAKYSGYDENKKINLSCTFYNSDGRKWLKLIVEDFGTGISKQAISKIFDPFFTTKGKDKGTGLGLSISYGIIRDHHGEIIVESEEGKHTRFIVHLPCDNGWDLD